MRPVARHVLPDTTAIDESGRMSVGGCDLVDLADRFGTPLFVYDEVHIRNRCREAVAACGEGAIYASKAFLCRAMARLVHEEGMRIDVSTGGEMAVAVSAGVPPDRLVFHGNNKSNEELASGIEAGRLVVDSFDELDRLEKLASPDRPVNVLLRITPGVEAHTHEYVATGQADSKFGFSVADGSAAQALERALANPALSVRGLHCHIGSQVFRVESFAEALAVVGSFVKPYGLAELVVGGGLGVAYLNKETAPTITDWAAVVKRAARQHGITAALGIEPGRAIVAAAAVTLYRVGTIKDLPGIRTYVAVDGGMSDNPRPVLYGSGYETFLPRAADRPRPRAIRLVGKHCESGDVLVRAGHVPADLVVGDVIATPVTGAYGFSMGSNYNKVPRPAVVFVAGGEARLVVRRETYADLAATDVG